MKEALYLLDCLYYSDDRDLKEPPPTMKNFREGVFKFRDGTKENHPECNEPRLLCRSVKECIPYASTGVP